MCPIKTEYFSACSSAFWLYLDYQAKSKDKKRTHEEYPKKLPVLEYPCPIFLLTNAIKINRGATIDVSKFAPGFMLEIYSYFFKVEIICGFTLTFVAIFSATSHLFGSLSRSKPLPIFVLKFLVTTLRNQDKKVAFI